MGRARKRTRRKRGGVNGENNVETSIKTLTADDLVARSEGLKTKAVRLYNKSKTPGNKHLKRAALKHFREQKLLDKIVKAKGEGNNEEAQRLIEHVNKINDLYKSAHAALSSGARDKAIVHMKNIRILEKRSLKKTEGGKRKSRKRWKRGGKSGSCDDIARVLLPHEQCKEHIENPRKSCNKILYKEGNTIYFCRNPSWLDDKKCKKGMGKEQGVCVRESDDTLSEKYTRRENEELKAQEEQVRAAVREANENAATINQMISRPIGQPELSSDDDDELLAELSSDDDDELLAELAELEAQMDNSSNDLPSSPSGGRQSRKHKSHKRKSRKHKSHKRKSRKHKSHKRKSRKHKSHKRKSHKRKTRKH